MSNDLSMRKQEHKDRQCHHRHALHAFVRGSFLVFFLCRRPQSFPANAVLRVDCDGEIREKMVYFPLRQRLRRGPLASQGGAIGRATHGRHVYFIATRFALPAYCCNPVEWLILTTVYSVFTTD